MGRMVGVGGENRDTRFSAATSKFLDQLTTSSDEHTAILFMGKERVWVETKSPKETRSVVVMI